MAQQRQRVTRACDRCRTLKSKCDGARPICSRCSAYGYQCTWEMGGRRGYTHENVQSTPGHISTPVYIDSLRRAVQAYDGLVVEMRNHLGELDRSHFDERLRQIRMALPTSALERQQREEIRRNERSRQASADDQSLRHTSQPQRNQPWLWRQPRTDERFASESQQAILQPQDVRSDNLHARVYANFSSDPASYVSASTAASDVGLNQVPIDFSDEQWPFGITDASVDWNTQFEMPDMQNAWPAEFPWNFNSAGPS